VHLIAWILLAGLLLGVAFLAGLRAGHRRTWPFGLLQRLRPRRSDPPAESDDAPTPTFAVTFGDAAQADDCRERLHALIWQGTGVAGPSRIEQLSATNDPAHTLGLEDLAEVRQGVCSMDHGIDSRVVLFSPRATRQATAVIYQQGHEGHIRHGREVIRRLLAQGHPVAALAMPLLGGNNQPWVDLPRHGPVRLREHDWFWFLDHAFGACSIRFFIAPVWAALRQLEEEGAGRIAMLGWSGGGWTTTLCAALEPRISLSFAVAGSLPFGQRVERELADYENHLPALYDVANYPELYVLSALGTGRRAVQVLNRFDTVAWHGTRGRDYEAHTQAALKRCGDGRFEVWIDESWAGHGISRSAMDRIAAALR